jgi:hypothetical protein
MRNPQFSRWVILSGANDLRPASFITPRKQRDTNSADEIPHFVRNDLPVARRPVPFTSGQ